MIILRLLILVVVCLQSCTSRSCNFENFNECSWYFTNLHDLNRILKAQRASPANNIPQKTLYPSDPPNNESEERMEVSKDANFYVVVSGGANISNHYAYFMARKRSENVAMIVSPFYESASSKCELSLRYRILGENGAELLVTTEQLTLSAHLQDNQLLQSNAKIDAHLEDDDWVRPTLRARFLPEPINNEPWITNQIPIGTFTYPTRIRIECHATGEELSDSDLNVECHIDDLQLINCEEELYQTEKCADSEKLKNRKYSCRSNEGKEICLRYEDLCDMHPECANDEDEDEELHSCAHVPLGARCTFEDSRIPTGCSGWTFFNSNSNASASAKSSIVNVINNDRTNHRQIDNRNLERLPPNEYMYSGKLYKPGHFLFFSSYNYTSGSEHEIIYSSAISPLFPPVPNDASPLCMLRFFYCHTGSSPFQVFLINKGLSYNPKPLWAPNKYETNLKSCEWKKASVAIQSSVGADLGSSYYLKLSFAKIAGSLGSIAIDDLSLSPSCFADYSKQQSMLLPSIFVAGSCGISGNESPQVDRCIDFLSDSEDNKTNVNDKIIRNQNDHTLQNVPIVYTGNRKWIVPKTGMYSVITYITLQMTRNLQETLSHLILRVIVEVYGGAGGKLPFQSLSNGGGAIVANVHLISGSRLEFIIGQHGETPCDTNQTRRQKLTAKTRLIREMLCTSNKELADFSMRSISGMLFGGGGGGATILFLNSAPVIVAGGGGGTFPTIEITSQTNRAEGGFIVEVPSSQLKKQLIRTSRNAGNGASINERLDENHAICDDCDLIMNGNYANKTYLQSGTCPSNRLWKNFGGFGGGGASCGQGGGGGAGYTGGVGGERSNGAGGSSAFLLETGEFIAKMNANPENGQIKIFACSQEFCPLNSTCQFENPEFDEIPRMFCLCDESGDKIPLNGTCYTCMFNIFQTKKIYRR